MPHNQGISENSAVTKKREGKSAYYFTKFHKDNEQIVAGVGGNTMSTVHCWLREVYSWLSFDSLTFVNTQ